MRDISDQQISIVRAEADARIEANRIALDAARVGLRIIRGEFRAIQGARLQLIGEYEPAQLGIRSDAMSRLRSAVATGDMTGAGDAAEIAARISEADYTSSSQFQAEQARTLYLLAQAEDLAGEQVDHAEAAVVRLEEAIESIQKSSSAQIAQMRLGLNEQIAHMRYNLDAELAALDQIYKQEAAQLNALWGINDGVLSVADAISALASAMGVTSEKSDVPQFANGGTHMGGLRIVGERGPELEATGPARYMNNSQLMSALGGGGDIDKMRQDLMAGLRAIEKNTREIKQIEQRWDRIGLPESREFA